jgi:AraC family transcriptional regulator
MDPGLLQRIGDELGGASVALRPLFTLHDPFLAKAIVSLERDVQQGSPLGPIYGESIGAAIATHLVRHHTEIAPRRLARAEMNAGAAQRMCEWIHSHLSQPILLSDLAGIAGLDIYQLTRAFKKQFGVPPHHYILRARVSRAKALLVGSNASLADVADVTGFSSQSHLTKVFTRLTGLSPAKYRRSAK